MSKGSFLCKNKAELLIELSSFYKTVDKKEDLQYLFLFSYSSGSTDSGAVTDEWGGKVKAITDKL